MTSAIVMPESRPTLLPTGSSEVAVPLAATTVIESSTSARAIVAARASNSASSSSATAANTWGAGDSCATSVATRRSAACSSASRSTSVRASMLAIAVSSRPANFAIRSSVSGGGGRSPFQLAVMTPQRRPWTVIGAETLDRRPVARASSASGPGADA